MMTFEKVEYNPIMTNEINGKFDIKDWRDPFVWKDNGCWYMVLWGYFEFIVLIKASPMCL